MADAPAFIPIARPWMDETEAQEVRRVINSGWITQGPEVAAFEKEFAAFVGADFACAVSSCTTALHLALLAAGVRTGDEVITASHTFIATANAIRHCGAIPVFCDINPATYNLDPALLDPLFSAKTRAIVAIHQIGMPCDIASIRQIGERHGIPVIEDAACAMGSETLRNTCWEKIGKAAGTAACFSFHPRKILTTGDGGMITTSNPEWDHFFRLMRQHAMSVPDTVRHASSEVVFESYVDVGFNYRMTDIGAAIGRVQLNRVPEMIVRRRELAARYRDLLGELPLILPDEPQSARSNWQSYCVRLPDGADQKRVMQALLDRGIATRRGVMCVHREPAYANVPWKCGGAGSLRHSEEAQDRSVIVPLYHQMTDEEQIRVRDALRDVLKA